MLQRHLRYPADDDDAVSNTTNKAQAVRMLRLDCGERQGFVATPGGFTGI